jgi:excisionase family DNA binding protein
MCPHVTRCEVLRALVEAAEPGELPALAGELAHGYAAVLTRIASAAAAAVPNTMTAATTSLLTVEEAADRMATTTAWLYRHAKRLPFSRKLGHRTLRFDAQGLDRWVKSRPPA